LRKSYFSLINCDRIGAASRREVTPMEYRDRLTLTEVSILHYMYLQQILLNPCEALILLDGLDEVREEDSDRILNEIREFSDRFPNNQFVMTCRIAAREYTFEKFTIEYTLLLFIAEIAQCQ
jgi:predicted NACHT family NTPase